MLARTRAETESTRGRLRVYLGMAPGVGKTYKMLEEAHTAGSTAGRTSSSASSRPHGRFHTVALLDGLEILSRRRVEYRGVVIEEMDTDAVIARHPTVRHRRRARPHERARARRARSAGRTSRLIRDAGIHVISTCNVQHLESIADAVATITGAPVNERLPDDVLAAADEIELVEHEAARARQRMRHGNV